MIFKSFVHVDGLILATAEGHPDEVVSCFRSVCSLLLSGRGPWRITKVHGICPEEIVLESDMVWSLSAQNKG